jgi:hypothetical protein
MDAAVRFVGKTLIGGQPVEIDKQVALGPLSRKNPTCSATLLQCPAGAAVHRNHRAGEVRGGWTE